MTFEEKEKFYMAIGYSGSTHNLALPRQVNKPTFSPARFSLRHHHLVNPQLLEFNS